MDKAAEFRIHEIGVVHTKLTQDTIRSDARDLHAVIDAMRKIPEISRVTGNEMSATLPMNVM